MLSNQPRAPFLLDIAGQHDGTGMLAPIRTVLMFQTAAECVGMSHANTAGWICVCGHLRQVQI